MEAWTDLSAIPMPLGVAALPIHLPSGYPVPAFVLVKEDGTVDFKVLDPARWADCVKRRRCAICGQKMRGLFAFVGGPLCAENHTYTDAPMHKECAEYAMRVCPFLAAPKYGYNKLRVEGVRYKENVSTARPDKFALCVTSNYWAMEYNGEVILRADMWVSVDWWRHGVKV